MSRITHPENHGGFTAQFLGSESAFLENLNVANDGVILEPSGKTRRYPAPFATGFIEMKYELTETTNWHSVQMPLRSALRWFSPHPSAKNQGDLYCTFAADLEVQKIELADSGRTDFLAPAKLFALDRRPPDLPKQITVDHIITNDTWKPASDPDLIQLAKIYRKSAERQSHGSGELYRIILTILISLPLVVLLIQRQRASRTTTNKQ